MIDPVNIAFVTDEVSRDLREALTIARGWGVSRFELREGSEHRTPYLNADEIALIDEAVGFGDKITALSPGVFKQPVEDEATIKNDLNRKLPDTLEMAAKYGCETVIIFGFEKMSDEASSRLAAQRIFEYAAKRAEEYSIVLAIENEPEFWIDKPEDSISMIQEIDHPRLRLNWDPANLHWGGTRPTAEHVEMLAPYIRNLHVKDFTPDDPRVPWRPLGEGITPWDELLDAFISAISSGSLDLAQFTIETHWEPLKEGSERSLGKLKELFDACGVEVAT